ncbi:MAG TPA: carboxypeptidase-like regulatory domain-containing protein [Chitinophagaceae bacterium]
MAKENDKKHFTAADIERYHQGLLSPKERHALEKAALDDPFLADALDGYAYAGANTTADLDSLQQRLENRISNKQNSKVIALSERKKTSYPWLRVAAMVIVLAGAGLLVYQLGLNKKDQDIAMTTQAEKQQVSVDTNTVNTTVTSDSVTQKPTLELTNTNVQPQTPANSDVGSTTFPAQTIPADTIQSSLAQTDNLAERKIETAPSAREDKETKAPARDEVTVTAAGAAKPRRLANDQENVQQGKKETDRSRMGNSGIDTDAQKGFANSKRAENNYNLINANTFRGRVTDNNNNPVPFANVTNVEDNVGTYADARGYFNLTSPDSTLNVQVKSLGFNVYSAQLRNNVPNNQVVLQEDKSLNEVVISNKKPNASTRAKDANMTLEEAEPEDGWDNYDTYLANNLVVSDDYKYKKSSTNDVKVSFEVNKFGEPVNFKIVKSLCTRCDQEAIRLVKEGPKWKRKARRGRTTVTISF